jgi:hypothetical protein
VRDVANCGVCELALFFQYIYDKQNAMVLYRTGFFSTNGANMQEISALNKFYHSEELKLQQQ